MRLSDNSQGCVRSILVTIIIGTIPFYILGIIVWLVPSASGTPANTPDASITQDSDSTSGGSGDSGVRPTWTPIDPDALVTLQPVTGTVTLVTAAPTSDLGTIVPTVVIPSATLRGAIPIVPTEPPRIPSATPTIPPTFTPQPTNTQPPLPTSTQPPTATQPVLMPPTDTPAP